MLKKFLALSLLFSMLTVTGCANKFSSVNVDRLHIGMPANDVKEIFGTPNRIRSAVCGTAIAGGQWLCETWTYNDVMTGLPTNTLTFSVKDDIKSLNHWSVETR